MKKQSGSATDGQIITQAGAATAIVFGLTADEAGLVIALAGFLMGVIGLTYNIWYKRKKLRILKERDWLDK